MTLAQLKTYVKMNFENGVASMATDAILITINNIIDLVLTAAPLDGMLAGLISDTSTDPGTPAVDMVYITVTPGSYTNFPDSLAAPIVVPADAILAFLTYSVADEYWTLSSVTQSALGAIIAVTNKASGGSIGTAATTVDIANYLTVNQTTVGQTLTLTTPTATTKVRNVFITNIGTADFIMAGVTITAGGSMEYLWNGSAWKAVAVNDYQAVVALTDTATGSIGTAATTVDITNNITINQTTAGQALTMTNPTTATIIRPLRVYNIGSASFTLGGVTISAGGAVEYVWTGAAWKPLQTLSFGALVGASLAASGAISSSSGTAGIGYATGAGGAVTQLTSKATAVTLSKVSGTITTAADSLAGAASVTFVLTNAALAALTDVLVLNVRTSGAAVGKYTVNVTAKTAGTADITITNIGSTASEVLVIDFVILKGVAA